MIDRGPLLKNIDQKIKAFLKKKGLKPETAVETIFADDTRHCYYSFVKDKKGEKFFFKVRIYDTDFEKEVFLKPYQIGTLLNKHPQLKLNQFTSKMVDGSLGGELDWLLYEYVSGKSLGSRWLYDINKLKISEIPQVMAILEALEEIPLGGILKDLEKRKAKFYHFLVFEDKPVEESFLLKYFSRKELAQIKEVVTNDEKARVFDQFCHQFSHSDLQPPNFLRTKKGIMVLDFDHMAVNNALYDLLYLWIRSLRRPKFRKALLEAFFKKYSFEKYRELFWQTLLVLSFRWTKSLFHSLKLMEKGIFERPDFEERKKVMVPKRVKETKRILNFYQKKPSFSVL